MKKIITRYSLVFIVHLLFPFSLFAQEMFNHHYSSAEISRSVFQTDDGGYALIGGIDVDDTLKIRISKFDELGNPTWNKVYGIDKYFTYHGMENSCIKTDGGYILAGAAHYGNQDTSLIYILRFDEQFDTLWTRKYFKDTNWVTTRGICNTDDGGFMVVGETQLKPDSTLGVGSSWALMLKLDAQGNYEWFNSFGTDTQNDYFYKAVQTHDGGYLVGGATMSWQENLAWIDKGDWYIVKTDSQGNEQWNRRYGNPIYDDGRITQILRTRDTSYYITGSWTYGRNSTGSDKWKESYVVKLDKDFNDVYELKYDNQAYWKSYPMAAIESNDDNIVLIGRRYTDYAACRAIMHKITPDGDIIWQRPFVAANDTTWSYTYGNSIKQTTDNGFIIGGWMDNNNYTPDQQMWMAKTDSMGCDGTGDFWDCSTGINYKEFASNPEFYIYPNPAKDYFTISNKKFRFDEVSIYDLSGKLAKQIKISGSQNKISVLDLERGVYFVKIGEQIQKIVVE